MCAVYVCCAYVLCMCYACVLCVLCIYAVHECSACVLFMSAVHMCLSVLHVCSVSVSSLKLSIILHGLFFCRLHFKMYYICTCVSVSECVCKHVYMCMHV